MQSPRDVVGAHISTGSVCDWVPYALVMCVTGCRMPLSSDSVRIRKSPLRAGKKSAQQYSYIAVLSGTG